MNKDLSRNWKMFPLLLLFGLAACQAGTGTALKATAMPQTSSDTPKATATPRASPNALEASATPPTSSGALRATATPEASSPEAQPILGPGPFDLPDTREGLANLSSYQATLTITFDGSENVQPRQWSSRYEMLYRKQPPARRLTVENSGVLTTTEPVFVAEMNGTAYERRADGPCTASVPGSTNFIAERWEPAGLLPGLLGADAAGHLVVDGTETDHYTFDERALGLSGSAQSRGELWVAAAGGYVLRYQVTTKGSDDYFGRGMQGTLSWDYQVTQVNRPVAIDLPEDCPGGLVDAPMLPDAANVLNLPNLLSYDTAAGLADAVAFYQAKIPSQGWTMVGDPGVNETMAVLDFTKGGQTLTVVVVAGSGSRQVRISLGKPQE